MAAPDLIFSQPPIVGAPALVFGESDALPVTPVAPIDPRALVFQTLVADVADIRALVFGADADVAPPVSIATVTVQANGQITGLRGHITLRTIAVVQAAGQISGLRGHLSIRTVVVLGGAGRISGLRGSMAVQYLINVERPTVSQASTHWRFAVPASQGIEAPFQAVKPLLAGVVSRPRQALNISSDAQARWQTAAQIRRDVQARFDIAQAVQSGALRLRWQTAVAQRVDVRAISQAALCLDLKPVLARFQSALRDRYAHLASAWQQSVFVASSTADSAGYAEQLAQQFDARWQTAQPPRPGRSARPVPPASMPCYAPSPNLLFDAPWSSNAALVFSCERKASALAARIVIPILRTYVTVNFISLHRLDTGAELHAHGFNMALDADSWTWSWSASLHHDAANHLGRDAQGDPAELAVLVNGIAFRLRLGTVSRDRRFSPTRWAVSGKGKAAILGAPYAPRMSFGNTEPRTAQQLMADVLTVNGVSLGWTVDWGLTDWLVLDGAWALQGSYIEAINDIAVAAGGYVQPHATDAVLRVLPRYPAAPWAWNNITPDFEIPADAAEVEATEYVDKPAYNRVFVGGVGAGVFGPFKRTGTAGDMLAPQVNHALITHADAHRQRGLAELSDTGRQEHITLKMQVLPETGIITPGQFVRYLGDKTVMGIVRSTSIDWNYPKLRQTLRLETHE